MRKIIILAVCLLVGLSLFAGALSLIRNSSQSSTDTETQTQEETSQEEAVRQAIVDYFRLLKLGEPEEAAALLAEDCQDSLDLLSRKEEYISNFAQTETGDYSDLASDFYDFQVASAFKEYEISQISVSGTSASALVTVTGSDISSAQTPEESAVEDYMNSYIEEHEAELQELYEAQGEEAVTQELSRVSAEYTFEQMKENLKAADESVMNLRIGLKESGGEWKISSIASQDSGE